MPRISPLTIKLRCEFNIISYTFTTLLSYLHNKYMRVHFDLSCRLAELDGMLGVKSKWQSNLGVFSCLQGNVILQRQIGYHIVQTYVPTALIVVISWVSFWIDPSAIPARISLSFTTLLTLSTMAAGVRVALPPVSYAKAIGTIIDGRLFWSLLGCQKNNTRLKRSY